MEPGRTILLKVHGDADSDRERIANLAWDLRQDLLTLDVEQVEHPAIDAPAGAKGTAVEWAQLVVTLVGTAPSLMGMLEGWMARHRGCSLTMEIDGDSLTLEGLSREDQRALAETWLTRHHLR